MEKIYEAFVMVMDRSSLLHHSLRGNIQRKNKGKEK